MTETEFRIKHSELIGYYQLIEMRLKGLCARVFTDELDVWIQKMDQYCDDSFGELLVQIRKVQKQTNIFFLSQADLQELDDLRLARNYWVHQCFGGNEPVVFSHHTVKKPENARRLERDLQSAIAWDNKLTEVFIDLGKLKMN